MLTWPTPATATASTPAPAADFRTHKDALLYLKERAAIGLCPFAYAWGMSLTDATTAARTLAAAGGTTLVPILIPSAMFVQSLSIYNTDTGTARSWEWRLFREPDAGGATLEEVPGINGSESFTPGGAASVRTDDATTPGLILPGMYWLAVRNTHGSNTFGIGTAAAGTINGNAGRTKTIGSALTTTLDAVTGWSNVTAPLGARLNGRVFAEGAAY
jgi:hypothetical protein